MGTFSKGMLQRLGIAQALMNTPRLLFLDEPTDGVDPVGRREIRTLIESLRDDGVTVFLNSHLLSEVERICTRVAIMKDGVIVRDGTVDDLTRTGRAWHLTSTPLPPETAAALADAIEAEAPRPDGLVRMLVTFPGRAALNDVLDRLRADGVEVEAVEPARQSLEDLFVEVVGGETSDAAAAPGAVAPRHEAYLRAPSPPLMIGLFLLTLRELRARKVVVGLFVVATLVWVALALALQLDVVDGSLAGARIMGQEAVDESYDPDAPLLDGGGEPVLDEDGEPVTQSDMRPFGEASLLGELRVHGPVVRERGRLLDRDRAGAVRHGRAGGGADRAGAGGRDPDQAAVAVVGAWPAGCWR